MMRPRVYISGPISNGGKIPDDDQHACLPEALRVWDALMRMGMAPLCPHLTVYAHKAYPQTYEAYIESDLSWILASEAVLRISGESKGADIECDFAKETGIPVYHSIPELSIGVRNARDQRKRDAASNVAEVPRLSERGC